jgi:tripartite-type tricarboxylate transporter receptor subunit TctC
MRRLDPVRGSRAVDRCRGDGYIARWLLGWSGVMNGYTLRRTCTLLLCCGLADAALAQKADYPNRPIRAIVPAVSGGPLDIIGRLVGQKLLAAWGQNVLIDNRPGAGGILGSELVAKSPPDGYTMLHFSSAHALLPAFN